MISKTNTQIRISVIERFLNKIKILDSGCWKWISTITNQGYGQFWFNGKQRSSHRFIYKYYHGEVNSSLVLDHLCRNRKCVNPEHLEQVSIKENILRGNGFAALNIKKTHCKNGHEFIDNNTHLDSNGHRRCKFCNKIRQQQFQKRKKLEVVNWLS